MSAGEVQGYNIGLDDYITIAVCCVSVRFTSYARACVRAMSFAPSLSPSCSARIRYRLWMVVATNEHTQFVRMLTPVRVACMTCFIRLQYFCIVDHISQNSYWIFVRRMSYCDEYTKFKARQLGKNCLKEAERLHEVDGMASTFIQSYTLCLYTLYIYI